MLEICINIKDTGVFPISFEQILDIELAFPLITLNK